MARERSATLIARQPTSPASHRAYTRQTHSCPSTSNCFMGKRRRTVKIRRRLLRTSPLLLIRRYHGATINLSRLFALFFRRLYLRATINLCRLFALLSVGLYPRASIFPSHPFALLSVRPYPRVCLWLPVMCNFIKITFLFTRSFAANPADASETRRIAWPALHVALHTFHQKLKGITTFRERSQRFGFYRQKVLDRACCLKRIKCSLSRDQPTAGLSRVGESRRGRSFAASSTTPTFHAAH